MPAMEMRDRRGAAAEMATPPIPPDPSGLKVHPVRQALEAFWHIRPHTVFWLVSASLGLGLVAVQIETLWVLVVFSIFWGVTVAAMVAFTARTMSERPSPGRHRRVAV
ncbi:hypothetical protein GCM10009665_63250 [Kitasatospora nipponensis]|uniref:Sensor protein n=1 Tax=Kitasatospora nipponensis TaxID=258049 RepID=A0ABN1WTU5_9ACTN